MTAPARQRARAGYDGAERVTIRHTPAANVDVEPYDLEVTRKAWDAGCYPRGEFELVAEPQPRTRAVAPAAPAVDLEALRAEALEAARAEVRAELAGQQTLTDPAGAAAAEAAAAAARTEQARKAAQAGAAKRAAAKEAAGATT